MALYIATFLVAPGGPLVDREIEADDIGDAWHRAQLMPRRPGLLQDVREAGKPETDAELAARLVTKRDERIKGLSANLEEKEAEVDRLEKARAALSGEPSDYVVVPSDTLDWIFRSLCAYLDYFGVDSRCYDPKEAAEAIRPYTSLGNPSETPDSSEE